MNRYYCARRFGSLFAVLLLVLPIFTANQSSLDLANAQVQDTEPPFVIATLPSPDQTDIPVETGIAISFDEPIDIASLTSASFFVNDGSNNIEGVISTEEFGPEFVCFFTPVSTLEFSTTYVVTATHDVTDLAGNNLEAD